MPTTTITGPPVEICSAAVPAALPALRAMTGALALHLDLDLDASADLRLAVDEACARLVEVAAPDATLTCRFGVDGDRLVVTASARPVDRIPQTDGLSWRLVEMLVDSAAVRMDGSGAIVELIKCRVGHQ